MKGRSDAGSPPNAGGPDERGGAPIPFQDPLLRRLWEKLDAGERLDAADGLLLFTTRDLIGLGWMARQVRRLLHGDAATFVHSRVVNPSNVCELRCRFCSFSVDAADPAAYDLELEEIVDSVPPGVCEVHIVGGLHPRRGWDYYLEIVAALREKLPRATIKAWTAVEIVHFARRFGMTEEEVLRRLQEAGLDMLPGGGAEIFAPRVRRILCPEKPDAESWLEVHRLAHRLGLPSNATMLYGHVETAEERVDHLLRLRQLQEETRHFNAFIPLPFQPGRSGLVERRTPPTDDLRTIAASRLLLDNIPHVKAYWVMTGEAVAAAALHFGADDLDGTLGEERVAHAAEAPTPRGLTRPQLVRLIEGAGWTPVERDGRHALRSLHAGRPVAGMLPYLNVEPFHRDMGEVPLPLVPMIPRLMGRLAAEGKVDAGPFSLMDFFDLEEEFESLGFCIAVHREVRSVLLLSGRPPEHLDGRLVGVTEETSTSVCLMRLLLLRRFGVRPALERFSPAKLRGGLGALRFARFDAVLLIGDLALQEGEQGQGVFPFRLDLGQAWNEMTGLPFVFALWAARRTLDPEVRQELAAGLERSLGRFEATRPLRGRRYGRRLGLPPETIRDYLDAFQYRLGPRERRAAETFRRMYREEFGGEEERP